jgi:superfamily II DNA or RNA helicase
MHAVTTTEEVLVGCGVVTQDVVARARTGSGKTLAYVLPLLHKLLTSTAAANAACFPRALVLVPTRELCEQVRCRRGGALLHPNPLTLANAQWALAVCRRFGTWREM